MTDAQDPRLARAVRIEGGSRPSMVLALQTGGANSALNVMVRDLAGSASKFRATASEIRSHSKLLDSEKGQRLAELSGPLTAKLREAASTFSKESSRIERTAQTTSAVPPYSDSTPLHQLLSDQQLVGRFASLPQVEQAILTHRATHEPKAVLRWTQALLRQPIELSGITQEQHDAMRFGVLKALDQPLHDAIMNEVEQARQARHAIALTLQVLAEDVPGAMTELSVTAPELLAIARGGQTKAGE